MSKGSIRRPGTIPAGRWEAIFAHVAVADPDERQPQCGDCGGTRRVDGGPCPACAPTDDGPDEGENQ
jgi:hypothetical protein